MLRINISKTFYAKVLSCQQVIEGTDLVPSIRKNGVLSIKAKITPQQPSELGGSGRPVPENFGTLKKKDLIRGMCLSALLPIESVRISSRLDAGDPLLLSVDVPCTVFKGVGFMANISSVLFTGKGLMEKGDRTIFYENHRFYPEYFLVRNSVSCSRISISLFLAPKMRI